MKTSQNLCDDNKTKAEKTDIRGTKGMLLK